ncbi:hypothetical protein Dimus_023414, partial [Dionaea muscipula]
MEEPHRRAGDTPSLATRHPEEARRGHYSPTPRPPPLETIVVARARRLRRRPCVVARRRRRGSSIRRPPFVIRRRRRRREPRGHRRLLPCTFAARQSGSPPPATTEGAAMHFIAAGEASAFASCRCPSRKGDIITAAHEGLHRFPPRSLRRRHPRALAADD